MTSNHASSSSTFTIKDFRVRYCRRCSREIVRGETVKRLWYKSSSTTRIPVPNHFLCRDCYVDGHGDPIMEATMT
jgi:hypothetical protein